MMKTAYEDLYHWQKNEKRRSDMKNIYRRIVPP